MNKATKDTCPFHIFKDEVCNAAGISADRLHLGRLHAGYDAGEPVWMVAEEMKLRAASLMPPVKPVRLSRLDRVCVKRIKVK